MTLLNDAARAALLAGRPIHLATTNADGSPQLSMVWCDLQGDEIVVAHLAGGAKVANMLRDPRVVLTLEAAGSNPVGMAHHLHIQGLARVEPGGAPELLHALAQRYVGPGTRFPPMDNPPPGNLLRITPTKVGGVGPWTDASA